MKLEMCGTWRRQVPALLREDPESLGALLLALAMQRRPGSREPSAHGHASLGRLPELFECWLVPSA